MIKPLITWMLCILVFFQVRAQNTQEICLDGLFIYEKEIPRDLINLDIIPVWDTLDTYMIFKDLKVYSFGFNSKSELFSSSYFECYFINGGRIYFYDANQITGDCGNENQNYYYTGYLCEENSIEFFKWNGLERYSRTTYLPYHAYRNIWQFQYGKDVNIFSDFLNMTVKSICVDQLDVFDSKEGDGIGYLVRDDLVEVLEMDGEWAKVKFLKTDAVYWTYASCLE